MLKQQQQTNEQDMSEQKLNDRKLNERLSAFIDAEQSDIETSLIIDALLNDSEYKQQYIRAQFINDCMNEQVSEAIITNNDLRNNISHALESLPAHFSDDAVSLQTGITEDITSNSWFQALFKKSSEHKVISGLSVAASVMFVTLFSLQSLNSNQSAQYGDNIAATSKVLQSQPNPSLIQLSSSLPASYTSTATSGVNAMKQDKKQKYQWIEADPALSRQVRQYINEHENYRAAYNLQPKIRTATYQLSE